MNNVKHLFVLLVTKFYNLYNNYLVFIEITQMKPKKQVDN